MTNKMDNTIKLAIRTMISNFERDTGHKPKKIVIGWSEFVRILDEIDEHNYAFPRDPSDTNFTISIDGVNVGWSK